ncbi:MULTISPECIES: acetate--CoA ligase family protein [unclassified Brucella]|uniref:acetate--CoA ligase family protein n=1 Tax=unclassified Brucella TaxID=2632610 RepID=UPI00217DD174|nr:MULTISPECIES: acetate--CoA ligase family protein [unclassified Brucella]UWF68343.1 acetate--CoA ligase family protein [Brucella sp. 1315]UWF71461.1 acetate--CoA ligase family protein [Brucella sp. 2594]
MLQVSTSVEEGRISPTLRENFARLLAPRAMAFIGGGQVEATLKTLRQQDYAGDVYVVNPKRSEIAGYKCIPSIADLPVSPDAVFLAVNADATITALRELSAMKAGGVVCYASGFSEIGAAGFERNLAFVEAAGDMAVVGPNCYGLVNYVNHGSIWPALYPKLQNSRGAAVISQSGNVTGHLVSNGRSVPYSYLISAGNQAVLGFEDYIDYLIDDPNVTCLGLFMEGIRDVAAFSQSALRARAKRIPVIVCRSGRSELGAVMATSHTSSLAGQNEYYEALFARLGVIETDAVPQFLEMMKLASIAAPLEGERITVFSSSGGDNGLAADYCSFAGLQLPQPSQQQKAIIKPTLPDFGHVSNPLDFTAGYWGSEELLTPMFTTMLNGDYDAAMLVIDYPPVGSPYKDKSAHQAMDRALAAAGKIAGKPVFHASVNTESIPPEDAEALIAQGIVPLNGLHDAAQVVAKWANYCKMIWCDRRQGDAALEPKVPFAVTALPSNGVTVNEAESKRRLSSYGLNVPNGNILTIETIRELPETFDTPMVLKVLHDQLAHKTEVGGVALNIRSRTDAITAAERMVASVKQHDASIELTTFLMEPMQAAPLAELIVGVKRDPLFGLVLVIGAGGILVELLKDATPLLLPVSRADVENALRGLKSFALLDGFRGKPKVQLEPVIDAVMAIAAYAGDHRHNLLELDVNPLMLGTDSAIAVDALIIEHR